MRDRIISNVLIKMGSRIKKKELQFLENVLVEGKRQQAFVQSKKTKRKMVIMLMQKYNQCKKAGCTP